MTQPARATVSDQSQLAYSTLPLEAARSRVYSDKRAVAALDLTDVGGPADPKRAARFVSAVATILARYDAAETVGLGVCLSGAASAIGLSTPHNLAIEELRDQTAEVLRTLTFARGAFDQQVMAAGLSAVTDRNPLFGVLVVLDEAPAPTLRQDISIRLDATRSSRLTADYNARLFSPRTVERFLRHVARVLGELQLEPTTAIGAIRYVEDAEYTELLSQSSGGDPAFEGTVWDLLTEALARAPEQEVLEFEGRRWSLRDLDARADEIANTLAPRISAKGARIGIGLRPGPDQVAALIAVMKVGGVIAPLDTTLPASRLAAIQSDANLAAIVTEERLAAHFIGADLLILEQLHSRGASHAKPASFGAPKPDDPLYLLFTSGSTGRPKGVLVAHRTLANLIAWENRRRPTVGKRTLGRTSIAFDVGLQEVFSTIICGGILVIASENERAEVSALTRLLAGRQISRLFLPPVALHQMAESAEADLAGLQDLEDVIVAGERLRLSPAIRRFFRATPARLTNQYGPTETHVATEATLDAAPLRWPELPTIGRPLHGVRVYVLDASRQLAPSLVTGEVFIGGIAPALGYVGSPQMTEDRFSADPFADLPGSRMYRTGDRARWQNDGGLEFLGRADDQVKVRGYRVELGDLETNALTLPGVRLAAAKYWASEVWGGLALYLVLAPDDAPSLRELRESLRRRVPDYMLPPLHAIIQLEQLPLLATGKIDRGKLPAPRTPDLVTSAPRDTSERLASIWNRRLRVTDVTPDDDFLDLGGHSLLAIQIVSEVNDAFDIAVPLSTLLRGSSLRDFTEVVERLLATRTATGGQAAGSPSGLTSTESASRPPTPSPDGASSRRLSFVSVPSGAPLLAPSPAEARHLWEEIFVQHAYHPVSIRYDPGGTIVDVGANIGVFSRYALEEAKGGRVIAIEPAAELFECLSRNLGGYEGRVDLLEIGCADRDVDAALFSYFPQVPAMSSFHPDLATDQALLGKLLGNSPTSAADDDVSQRETSLRAAFETDRQSCELRRLSSVFRGLDLGHVDLLKIDVQRGEREVLRGVDDDDWQIISQVIVELQDQDDAVAHTAAMLEMRGFNIEIRRVPLHRGTNVRFVYARRP